MSGCCEFGREDELFPFEEKALKHIEGTNPHWKIGRNYTIPSWKEEIDKKLKKFENALCGTEEEERIRYIRQLLSRSNPSHEEAIRFKYLIENFLLPLLTHLVFFRTNEPEGKEELYRIINGIRKLSPTRKATTPLEALDIIISLLS